MGYEGMPTPEVRERTPREFLLGYLDDFDKVQIEISELEMNLDTLKMGGIDKEPERSAYRVSFEQLVAAHARLADMQDSLQSLIDDPAADEYERMMANRMSRLTRRTADQLGAQIKRIYEQHEVPLEISEEEKRRLVLKATEDLLQIEKYIEGRSLDEKQLTEIARQIGVVQMELAEKKVFDATIDDRVIELIDKIGDAQMRLRGASPVSARVHYERAKAQYAAVSHRLSEDQRRYFRSKLAAMTALVRQAETVSPPPPPEPPDEELTKQAIRLAIARASTASSAIALAAMQPPRKRGVLGALADSLKLK